MIFNVPVTVKKIERERKKDDEEGRKSSVPTSFQLNFFFSVQRIFFVLNFFLHAFLNSFHNPSIFLYFIFFNTKIEQKIILTHSNSCLSPSPYFYFLTWILRKRNFFLSFFYLFILVAFFVHFRSCLVSCEETICIVSREFWFFIFFLLERKIMKVRGEKKIPFKRTQV